MGDGGWPKRPKGSFAIELKLPCGITATQSIAGLVVVGQTCAKEMTLAVDFDLARADEAAGIG
jgi:hypothetical protein